MDGATDRVGRVVSDDLLCGEVDIFYVLNNAKAAGTFDLAVNATPNGANATLSFGLNGQPVGHATFGGGAPVVVPVGPITVGAGVSALRVTMPDPPHQCVHMHSLLVSPAHVPRRDA